MAKIRVERANVALYVEDFEAQYYLSIGYNVTDDYGNIIQSAIPTNVGTLQRAYIDHIEKIKELEAEIEKLKAEPKKTETAKKKPTTKANKETK